MDDLTTGKSDEERKLEAAIILARSLDLDYEPDFRGDMWDALIVLFPEVEEDLDAEYFLRKHGALEDED